MKRYFLILGVSVISISGSLAVSANDRSTDLRNFPAASVDDVIVPVPSEVFNVLDKLGSPNWQGQLRSSMGKNSGDRVQVALLLGTVIADGFVAVEAKDAEKVKEIGRDVVKLAAAISVKDAVMARSKSIVDKAEKNNWVEVRREFDGALQDVRSAMQDLNDDALAQLVSLGGWIRGTEVLTALVDQEFKQDKAELLHQPNLVIYFSKKLDSLPPKLKKDPLIAQIRKTLQKMLPLLGAEDGSKISQDDVKKINQMSSELVKAISAKNR